MPQLGPINWLMVYFLIWGSIVSIFLEIYWNAPAHYLWKRPTSEKRDSYMWAW
nr:ATP synthase F0 subunit 8 [Nipponacmea sp. JM-2022]